MADEVQAIFEEIYNDPEQFPIHALGGARFTDTLRHSWGCAIDINPVENFYCYTTTDPYTAVTGTTCYKYSDSPYCITPDSSVVRIFAKYGWGWGGGTAENGYSGWSTTADYMHFSVRHDGGCIWGRAPSGRPFFFAFYSAAVFPPLSACRKSLAEFRALWARKGLRSFSAAACTSLKIHFAERASNCPPLADNRGFPMSAIRTHWERMSSEMTELSASAGSEGYAACDDEAQSRSPSAVRGRGTLLSKKALDGLF